MDTLPNALPNRHVYDRIVAFCQSRLKCRPLAFTLRVDVSTLLEKQLHDGFVASSQGRLKRRHVASTLHVDIGTLLEK